MTIAGTYNIAHRNITPGGHVTTAAVTTAFNIVNELNLPNISLIEQSYNSQ